MEDGARLQPSAPSRAKGRAGRMVVGRLVGVEGRDSGRVNLHPLPEGLIEARTTLPLHAGLLGAEVVVLLPPSGVPVVTGVLQTAETRPGALEVSLDGEAVSLSAEREIVLRCGAASVTLRRETSTGLHRIKAAAVEIN